MPRNRWSVDEPDGTNFHELVVLPTLAPQLARPEHLRPVQPPAAPLAMVPAGDANSRAESEEHPAEIPPVRLFFLSASMIYMGNADGPRARPKKITETKNGAALEVFKMTRCELLQHVLQLHDLHQHYQPSEISGFPVKISWSGSPGGKMNAPTVRDDAEFKNVIDQLRVAKKGIVSIIVSFDMEHMEPYRSRAANVIDPRLPGWSSGDLRLGTSIPRTDLYSADAQLHGSIIVDLKEEWKCEEHEGTCYRNENGHFPVNRWKLKKWAAAIAANTTTPRDPPADLFRDDDARPSFPVKARGRTGPRGQGSDQGESDTTRLISAVIPLITSFSQNMVPLRQNDVLQTPSKPHLKRTFDAFYVPRTPSKSQASQQDGPPTSPLPPVETELQLFVTAFGKAKSLDENTVDLIFKGLQDKDYSPDSLDILTIDRASHLTGLSEGKAAALLKFARDWNGRVDRKRAKLTHSASF